MQDHGHTDIVWPMPCIHPSLMTLVPDSAGAPGAVADSTTTLLSRAQAGDLGARDDLFRRCLPPLVRWARGRLPSWARDISDTQDLVQDTVVSALGRLDRFEARHDGALHSYLRQAVVNRIRDELRRARRRPGLLLVDDRHPDQGPSPLERAVGAQLLEKYETALMRLSLQDREAIVARIELGCTYAEVAGALDRPSAEAARAAVARALIKLASVMDHVDG